MMNILDNLKVDSNMTKDEWNAFCRRYRNRNASTISIILSKRYNININQDALNVEIKKEIENAKK